MFHCNGWCFPWTVAASAGINVCLRKVDPAKIFELIPKHGVTHMCGAPIVYNTLINAPGAPKGKAARPVVGLIAGAAPPVAVLEGAESIGIKLTHVYGLTEVYGPASVCAEQPGWDELPADQRAQLKRRQGVPYPLRGSRHRARSRDHAEVPRDGETIGEVMFRGNIVMKGYLKNEKATQEAFAGGWFHTGDLGVLDEHGYVIIKDRSKDIIISGGENISSVEVEDILYKHPAVLFAAVVAKPDSEMGRSALRLRRAEGRRQGDGSRHHRLLPQPHVRLQDAEGGGVRRHPEDVHRQDPEIHAAQPGGFGEGDFGVACRSRHGQSAACPPSSAKLDEGWWARRLRAFAHATTPALARPADNTAAPRSARTCRSRASPRRCGNTRLSDRQTGARRIRRRLDRPANRPDAQNARRDRRWRKRRGAIRSPPPAWRSSIPRRGYRSACALRDRYRACAARAARPAVRAFASWMTWATRMR